MPSPTSERRWASIPAASAGCGHDLANGSSELVRGGRGSVGLEDARLCLDDLAERPEREAVAIGGGASLTPQDDRGAQLETAEELEDQAGLADSRLADQRDELGNTLTAHSVEALPKPQELVASPDERLVRVREIHPSPGPRRQGPPDEDRIGLSLRLNRLSFAVIDHMARRTVRRLVDENPVNRRRGLNSESGVRDVAPRHRLSGSGEGAKRHERLSGRHAPA